ncbi:MAG: ABC transporter ATP-binding protein [Clostridia bacterium]
MKRNEKDKSQSTARALRAFIPRYRPYLKDFTFDMTCSLIMALCGIAIPLLIRDLLYKGIAGEGGLVFKYVLLLGGAVLLLKSVVALCEYFVAVVGHVMGAKIERDMRASLFDKYMQLPHSFYDDTKIGQLMSRITSDLFEVTELSHHCPEMFFISGIQVIGSFIILSTMSLPLTIIIYVSLPFMLWFSKILNSKMRKAFRRQRAQVGEINANVEDSLGGIRVVKSFANENVEKQKFADNNDKFLGIKKNTYFYMGIFHSGIKFFNGVMYFLTIVFGCFFIMNGDLTAIDLVAFLLYTDSLLVSISQIIQFTEQFQLGMTGITRYNEIMDTPVDIKDSPSAVDIDNVKGDITLSNVTFKYDIDGKSVLNNINLSIKSGETVALVGPSGSGKTTICNLIPRFYQVTSGKIFIDDMEINDITLSSLRNNIGIVQQDVYLFYGTVLDNIKYGKQNASQDEVVSAAKKAGAHEFIMALPNGYDTIVGERGIKLSGGQKQRISIARVFLKNPPITILDEATSSLDNESEKIVQNSLDSLAKNRTTFVIAHRLSTIKNADKIIVLTENGVEEVGSHSELLARNGVYAKLYNV